MTSEATRKADRDARRKEEEKRVAERAAVTLKEAEAQAEARGEAELALLGRTSPLVRDEEHSFVQQPETEFTAEELQPNLTGIGVKGLEVTPPATIDIKSNDVVHKVPLTAERLETMTDNDIRDAGLLTDAPELVHPARIAPTSERQRTPLQRAPAAGPGTWPVPEDALPAVMPSDPPVEEGEDPGDASLTGYPPFKYEGRKVVVYSSEGARSEVAPDETRNAAALYLRLRNQFPHFTEDELSDEFIIQWEGRTGAKQSMRPSQELSQHGDTAVGDPRVTFVDLGEQRTEANQAQPRSEPLEPTAAVAPEAGLPSVNEPATRHKDDEKFGLQDGEVGIPQDKADLEAMALTKQYREAEEEKEAEAKEEAREEARKAREELERSGQYPPRIGQRTRLGLPAGASEGERSGEKPKPTQLPASGTGSTAPKPPLASQTKDALKGMSEGKETPKAASKPSEPKKGG